MRGWMGRRRVGIRLWGGDVIATRARSSLLARRAVFGDYRVFVGLLRFDTSALPDGATVTSASLQLMCREGGC